MIMDGLEKKCKRYAIFLRSYDEIVFLDGFSVDGKKLNTKDAGSFNYKGYTNV